jgi:hypothetical protein
MIRFPGSTLLNCKYSNRSANGRRDLTAVGFSEICLSFDCHSKENRLTDFTSGAYNQRLTILQHEFQQVFENSVCTSE